MLLYFFVICFSFLLVKSFPLKPLPPCATEMRLLLLWLWKQLSLVTCSGWRKIALFKGSFTNLIPAKFSQKMMADSLNAKSGVDEAGQGITVLDLPELVLESILERLPPAELSTMARVCTTLRERCRSDHLWETHIKQKWGRIIDPATYRERQWHIALVKELDSCKQNKQNGFMRVLSIFWPSSWIISKVEINDDNIKHRSPSPVDPIMSWHLALESGKLWFPAQVYNRENGHVGFMLSCYDAELSYDRHTDTFQARYPPHGRRAIAIESGVIWERIRAPPVDTAPLDLHISDCLNDLCPGDHIEIQWRRNKEFPYGWWYGVVGHLEPCDGNENYCRCSYSDTVVLEFHQYTVGSRWRRTTINRKDHREEGNEADGFYGGVRKLFDGEEIFRWKRLCPAEVLE